VSCSKSASAASSRDGMGWDAAVPCCLRRNP